jgi:YbgC/YbaW family acyl-CoA thioester hydrolase
MASQFTYTRRVEFADTDAAGVAHFASFFRYMEEAEHAFYRSLGSSAYRLEADRVEGMPRVSASCDYLSPVRYDDELAVHLVVREKTAKAIGYEVRFDRLGGAEPVTVARGAMKVVHVTRGHGARDWTVTELPAALLERIEVAPEPDPGPRHGGAA